MPETQSETIGRRDLLKAGAVAGAAITLHATGGAAEAQASKATLPTRKLGKTGVDVTILNQGTWQASGLDRILRTAYASGIRYFDTAKSYGSEGGFKKWFQQMPEVRKEIFLVTKDSPREPKQLIAMLDDRLDKLGTDYVDLIFCHAMGDHNEPLDWPKSKEFAETIEKIKKSGKAKFVGFSTHHANRAQYIQAAADGGFVDAIMLQYTPWLDKDAPLNKALDAAHKVGIGLVSMKQVAGQFGDAREGGVLDEVKKRMPTLKEKGLSPYQALLHAIWTDERISSSCVSMRNTDQIRENVEAARKFEPLKEAQLRELRDAVLASGPTLCADCDGRCALAAGTSARLGDLTRYLTYHDHHGDRGEARRLYSELTETERNWQGADLAAAREACPTGLDFTRLLPRVDERLA